ncbi:MAG TPA: hypothetical protein VGA13_05035 [Acidimicrobiales bacterium]|jgi:tight adherence protein B
MSTGALAALFAVAAGYGVHLLATAAMGWRGVGPGPSRGAAPRVSLTDRLRRWMTQAGLDDVNVLEFAGVIIGIATLSAIVAFALFGGIVAPVAALAGGATAPIAGYRSQRQRRRHQAREAWPRMIEELRILTGSVGRSIPQALFDVGRRSPQVMQPAFDEARRDWVLTTDFERSLSVLKRGLADPTADATCETLLVAHQVGGTDLDRRLESLVEDRVLDIGGRKDAIAKQAGARFARRFVLVVPVGMAMAGLSIGNGRAAFATAAGQVAVVAALAVIGGCWFWAGTIMRLPDDERVFDV